MIFSRELKYGVKELVQGFRQIVIQRIKGLNLFHFLTPAVAQAENPLRIGITIQGRAAHQCNQLPDAEFHLLHIPPVPLVHLQQKDIEQLLGLVLIPLPDQLLQAAFAVQRAVLFAFFPSFAAEEPGSAHQVLAKAVERRCQCLYRFRTQVWNIFPAKAAASLCLDGSGKQPASLPGTGGKEYGFNIQRSAGTSIVPLAPGACPAVQMPQCLCPAAAGKSGVQRLSGPGLQRRAENSGQQLDIAANLVYFLL